MQIPEGSSLQEQDSCCDEQQVMISDDIFGATMTFSSDEQSSASRGHFNFDLQGTYMLQDAYKPGAA